GVGITHKNLATHVKDQITRFDINQADTILQFSTLNFDASIEQIFTSLNSGTLLLMRGEKIWDVLETKKQINYFKVTIAFFPTAYISILPKETDKQWTSLRICMCGGETLKISVAKNILEILPTHARLENGYGPTETTIAALTYTVSAFNRNKFTIPIGTPYQSRSVQVLDRTGASVP
ncbi:AMP-binding protein, partial [Acetobacter senegalensis]|uniref:AMP-binding protein n=1 Tax=Acetobacter senegalensis TaxID=446692 RepID=UPI0012E8AE29